MYKYVGLHNKRNRQNTKLIKSVLKHMQKEWLDAYAWMTHFPLILITGNKSKIHNSFIKADR